MPENVFFIIRLLPNAKERPTKADRSSQNGGCDRDRTCDPYDVNVVLIPLSYTPVVNGYLFNLFNIIWQVFF